ncbi:hypothetical protein [Microbulbifer sp. JMSA003]|uniref:hypothetical protein n=1 Tax=unclassified Microbulbifer TaxID=2619833 RepID=UPI004039C971
MPGPESSSISVASKAKGSIPQPGEGRVLPQRGAFAKLIGNAKRAFFNLQGPAGSRPKSAQIDSKAPYKLESISFTEEQGKLGGEARSSMDDKQCLASIFKVDFTGYQVEAEGIYESKVAPPAPPPKPQELGILDGGTLYGIKKIVLPNLEKDINGAIESIDKKLECQRSYDELISQLKQREGSSKEIGEDSLDEIYENLEYKRMVLTHGLKCLEKYEGRLGTHDRKFQKIKFADGKAPSVLPEKFEDISPMLDKLYSTLDEAKRSFGTLRNEIEELIKNVETGIAFRE